MGFLKVRVRKWGKGTEEGDKFGGRVKFFGSLFLFLLASVLKLGKYKWKIGNKDI